MQMSLTISTWIVICQSFSNIVVETKIETRLRWKDGIDGLRRGTEPAFIIPIVVTSGWHKLYCDKCRRRSGRKFLVLVQ